MLDYHALKAWPFGNKAQAYSSRDAMLYALSIGIGGDASDPRSLRCVYESDLQVVPTFATTLAWPGMWWSDPRTGVDWKKLVHGEQSIRLLRRLPAQGEVIGRQRVRCLADKGPGRGAVAVVARELFDRATNCKVAEVDSLMFLRGDGGFSAQSGVADPAPPALPELPSRRPDIELDMPTLPQAALLYRLNGDLNPLHADPGVAQAAGFPSPILHGLATMGMAAHAVLKTCSDWDASRMRTMAVRFSAPVFPGETLRWQLWCTTAPDGSTQVRLRGHVPARDALVLDRGLVEFAAEPLDPVDALPARVQALPQPGPTTLPS